MIYIWNRFNRYIVECKLTKKGVMLDNGRIDLIDTQWNVNKPF